MALIVSYDTATPFLAVALARDGALVAERINTGDRRSHAERLNLLVAEVLEASGHSLKDVDAFAVGMGPGSYTGLRIGLSAAKGWCFALNKPLIGFGTLEALAAEYLATSPELLPGDVLYPMVDARRMEVFTAPHGTDGVPLAPATPRILDSAGPFPGTGRVIVFGDGADKATDLWEQDARVLHVPGITPSVAGTAACAARYHAAGRFADLAYAVPDYGKAANVAMPKQQGAGC